MKKITTLLTFCFLLAFGSTKAQLNCQAYFSHYTAGNLSVQFLDSCWTNSGNPSYLWNFGDGNTSTSANPLHIYNTAGTYVVQLNFSTTTGCSDSYLDTIVVGGTSCYAEYSYYVGASNTVTFYNNSTSNASYSWDFGDGNTSTLFNPTHTYSNAGAYGVTLTVNTGLGSTCTFYDTVYVNFCSAYYQATVGQNGQVNFANYSTASNQTHYYWNFGDGSSTLYTYQRQNVSHTYTTSGTYYVTLNLVDSASGCSNYYVDSVVVSVNTTPSCNANFTVAKDTSQQFSVFLYNNSSTGQTHQYYWDFGDGNSATGMYPSHSYSSFGSYIVCLTVSDPVLNCVDVFCDTIGMDSSGNLKSPGFGLQVRAPIITSITEEVEATEKVNIYPNPAESFINLDLNHKLNTFEVEVRDISGKVVLNKKSITGGKINQLDVSHLENGFYFLLLDQEGERSVEKIVISK